MQLINTGPYIHRTSKKHDIDINRKKFSKSIIKINKGDTVIWYNNDVIRHTVETQNPNIINSHVIAPGKTFQYTFPNTGRFIFNSSLYDEHKPMTVVVRDVTKGAEFSNSLINNFQISFKNLKDIIRNLIKTIKKNIKN